MLMMTRENMRRIRGNARVNETAKFATNPKDGPATGNEEIQRENSEIFPEEATEATRLVPQRSTIITCAPRRGWLVMDGIL